MTLNFSGFIVNASNTKSRNDNKKTNKFVSNREKLESPYYFRKIKY